MVKDSEKTKGPPRPNSRQRKLDASKRDTIPAPSSKKVKASEAETIPPPSERF